MLSSVMGLRKLAQFQGAEMSLGLFQHCTNNFIKVNW